VFHRVVLHRSADRTGKKNSPRSKYGQYDFMIALAYPFKKICCTLLFSVAIVSFAQDKTDSSTNAKNSQVQELKQDAGIDGIEEEAAGDNPPDAQPAMPDKDLASGRPAITVRHVPADITDKIKKQKEFRYANDPAYWKVEDNGPPPAALVWLDRLLRSNATEYILYAIISAIVLFVLYQIIVVNRLFIFTGSRKKKSGGEESDEIEPDEDIGSNLTKAIAQKNYRLAVRLSYLLTLKRLSAGNQIKLQSMATNYDYLRQMQSSPYYQEFRALTVMYEYVWYGEFEPDSRQFDTIHARFNAFNNRS
jgi:hypothetical protein